MNKGVYTMKQFVLASIILIIFSRFICLPAYGQLKVGDFLPKHRLEELKRISSKDFSLMKNPRMYILDFWSQYCGSCIVSFPKVEGLQYQFNDEIKIIAINPWDSNEEVRKLFERYNNSSLKREQFKQTSNSSWKGSEFKPRMTKLPALNGDKSWLDLFQIKGVPHHVWLNARGQVIAVTGAYNANAENVKYYLRTGTLPKIALKPYPESYNLGKNSLAELWGIEVFPYQKDGLMIRDFYGGDGGSVYGYQREGVVDSVKKTIRYSFVNTSIGDLYKAAWAMSTTEHLRPEFRNGWFTQIQGDTIKYADVLNERLLWEVSVPEYFIGPVNKNFVTDNAPGYDEWSFRAKFCAELELPLDRKKEAAELFINGLNQYFQQKLGVSARLETRKRHCLVLKKKENFKPLLSDTKKTSYVYDPESKVEKYLNYPFNVIFLDFLPYRIDHNDGDNYWITSSRGTHHEYRLTRNLPILDETGISGTMDMELHLVPETTNDPVDAFNIRLKGTGLYVEKELRDIDMLVISDSPIQSY